MAPAKADVATAAPREWPHCNSRAASPATARAPSTNVWPAWIQPRHDKRCEGQLEGWTAAADLPFLRRGSTSSAAPCSSVSRAVTPDCSRWCCGLCAAKRFWKGCSALALPTQGNPLWQHAVQLLTQMHTSSMLWPLPHVMGQCTCIVCNVTVKVPCATLL